MSNQEEPPTLCTRYLVGACSQGGGECSLLHVATPYLWQGYIDTAGWVSFTEDQNADLEKAFSQPGGLEYAFTVETKYADGVSSQVNVRVDLEKMLGHLDHPSDRWSEQSFLKLRRLSTPSYAQGLVKNSNTSSESEVPVPSSCPWRWYYDDGSSWKLFEEDGRSPMQCVLEAKLLAGQKVYRYEMSPPLPAHAPPAATPATLTFLVNFTTMSIMNLNTGQRATMRRRPVYVTPQRSTLRNFPEMPDIKPVLYRQEVPDNWYPIDQQSEAELVPLNPESLEHHLVASEFIKTALPTWRILDVFRLQNPFLWHKFYSKKQFMEQKMKNANEMLLFHGTASEIAVQSILRQNFDWRMSGKNAVVLGEGSYFARDASLSDKYTGGAAVEKTRWMFMARVLVGRYTKGQKGYKRPPSLDPQKPHGDLYDTCVNEERNPTIFVVFENDQCYPEYLISYNR